MGGSTKRQCDRAWPTSAAVCSSDGTVETFCAMKAGLTASWSLFWVWHQRCLKCLTASPPGVSDPTPP
jgi:hypothetical protein